MDEQHVNTLRHCFALLDYDQNKLYEACTQRLQQWHQSTRKSMNPMNLLDIHFTCLNHNKTEEHKPKYLEFLQTDVYVPEATTTLRQLLVKYNQETTEAASILLPQPAVVSRIPLPARVITQIPSSLPLQQNLTYASETTEE